jgi:glycosyltransferase involved in cell wall biosynthesis
VGELPAATVSGAPIEFVVPDGIDDPTHPSGGNRYDRRVIEALSATGRVVREHPVGRPADLSDLLAELPDDAVVVVDGLVGSAAPGVLVPASDRLCVVVLLHMPFAEASPEESVRHAERATLEAASAVVTTSAWARSWVLRHHGLSPERVRVATPGVDPAPAAWALPPGGRIICVAAVTRGKGHDILLAALARLTDLDWYLTCVGAVDLEPDFVSGLTELAQRSGLADRVDLAGPLSGTALDILLSSTDLLVSASHRESYGMAVTEALARAVPVVVTDVGGHPEAVGHAALGHPPGHPAGHSGCRPAGVLVPPADPDRLASALRSWLTDCEERRRLRAAAANRRTTLGTWDDTAHALAVAVDAAAANPITNRHRSPDTTPAGR